MKYVLHTEHRGEVYDDVVAYVPGIRKKNVERLMKEYAGKYPSAQIALYSTQSDGPIYGYN